MYTRQEAEHDGYTLYSFGHIRNPGKFEGEHFSILYFYDCYLDGGDTIMELTEEEKTEYDINANYVYRAESNHGFCSLEFYNTREAAEKRANYEYIMNSIDFEEWEE